MYVVLLFGLLALGASGVLFGRARGRLAVGVAGAAAILATLGFFASMSLWGEYLWFEQLGFGERYLTALLATAGTALAGVGLVAGFVALVTSPVGRDAQPLRLGALLAGGLLGGVAGARSWEVVLAWRHRVDTGTLDPILGLDLGFYLFSLPFWELVHGALTLGAWISLGVALWGAGSRSGPDRPALEEPRPLHTAFGALALVLGAGRVLDVFQLLGSHHGVVHGPGWTDVHVRLPALLVTAVALAIAGLALIVPGPRRALEGAFEARFGDAPERGVATVAAPLVVAGTVWAACLGLLPALVQALVVTPNELTLERPYLEHAITSTRRSFGLDAIEERPFHPGELTAERLQDDALDEVRLWDPRALDQVLEQFQELRLYYEISDVDVDRYTLGGRYRQVMVAPREMETHNLPPVSRTFVNRHFKYTHGYALAMAPVSDFTPDGLPRLVLRDLPPSSEHPELAVTRPEIYFGEHTDDYVVVNSRTAEFDHPTGNGNAYTRYAGSGGVPMAGLWRRFVYGWKLGGTSLLFSGYPQEGSRILFRRNVEDRVAAVAPFLRLDRDPYLTLVDGRLHWILDAYSASSRYPYSEPVVEGPAASAGPAGATPWGAEYGRLPSELAGANYVRNSVKVVVDAYEGTVDLYVFDPHDPIVQVWASVFPDLFHPASEMPDGLRAHVRYPEGLLRTQGQVYAKYHMRDPVVFYNQEDLWVHATETHEGGIRTVEPYHVMWRPPGGDRAEFVVMQPFTPKDRQVLAGWVAGMCDGENYGRLIAYRFPTDQWVLGPQQVNTKIDQDPALSAQLTLWDQLGKRVIRGNVLAIPLDDTLLYVEPIYLQAQAAAYPELRMVVVMHGEDMSFAPTFDEALAGLVGEGVRPPAASTFDAEALAGAREAFEAYVRNMGEQRFEEAARELRALGDALGRGAEVP